MIPRRDLLLALALALITGTVSIARADFDAVIPAFYSDGLGYGHWSVYNSFTVHTNLRVTSVEYFNTVESNAVIRFWAGTNVPLASYVFPTITNGPFGPEMIRSNAALTLLAGRRYSISLQSGAPAGGWVQFGYYMNAAVTNFKLGPYLSDPVASTLSTRTGLWQAGSNYFFEGANFRYQLQSDPISQPRLTVKRSNYNTVVLSWPLQPTVFMLQESVDLPGNNWTYTTNEVDSLSGSNRVVISTSASNRFYRLFLP